MSSASQKQATSTIPVGRGRARSPSNIALAKYWGKSPLSGEAGRSKNLTAVPSLSMTLDGLETRTEVILDDSLSADLIGLNAETLSGEGAARVSEMLDRVRDLSEVRTYARVVSENNFPTAAGLASSASGFSALAWAASRAYGLELSRGQLSSLARQSSASAGRSLFDGYVELEAEALEAAQLAPPEHFELSLVVAVLVAAKKPVGSTLGMIHTARTSPYYGSWVAVARESFEEVRSGILNRDFERVGNAMEQSTRLMHATMFTSVPPVLYFRGSTVELMHELHARRKAGHPEAYTMDAGPNVKVLTPRGHEDETKRFLESFPGVERAIVCRPGRGTEALDWDGPLASASPQRRGS